MPSFTRLLARLERYDTYPAADALSAAYEDVLAAAPPVTGDPAKDREIEEAHAAAAQAGTVIWDQWRSTQAGNEAWLAQIAWAEERLSNWHSFKVNALQSAWQTDPTGTDLEAMRRTALINLRQGVHDHPDMLADGHFIQALARGGHRFSWTHAVHDLRSGGVPLPEDALIGPFCLLAANAFRWLIG